MKYFEKRKLDKFLKNLKRPCFTRDYLDSKTSEIDWIKWLIASYDGMAGDPKEMLEALITSYRLDNYNDYVKEMEKFHIEPLSEVEKLKSLIKDISFMYYWVYYKKITGF